MMMLSGTPKKKNLAGGKRQTKGLKLVKEIYPPQEESEINVNQLDALLKFLSMNPDKIFDVGKYLEKRVGKELHRGRYGFVLVSMDALNSMLRECHSNLLNFYSNSVASILLKLYSLDTQKASTAIQAYNMKVVATQTFARLMKARNGYNIESTTDLNVFVRHFVEMINNKAADPDTKAIIRDCGFKGLLSYIVNLEDIDNFIANYVDVVPDEKSNVINTLLTTLSTHESPLKVSSLEEIEGIINSMAIPTAYLSGSRHIAPNPQNDSQSLNKIVPSHQIAFDCLQQLGCNSSAISTKSLLTSIFGYLHSNQMWNRPEFVRNCIRAVSSKAVHTQITALQLLLQLDRAEGFVDAAEVPATKTLIVNALISFFSDESSPSGNASEPMIEILLPLIRHLQKSAELGEKNAAENAEKKESSQQKLQKKIIHCIGKLSRRVSDPSEKIESISYLMTKVEQKRGQVTVQHLLLEAVVQIFEQLKELPPLRVIPPETVDALVSLSNEEDQTTRQIVLNIFIPLLNPNIQYRSTSLSSGEELDERTKRRDKAIRKSLFKQLFFTNNLPINYVLIFNTFDALLRLYGAKELEHTLPIVFHVEDLLRNNANKLKSNDPVTAPPAMAQAIHSTMATYLFEVAKLFGVPELKEHVEKVMDGKWSRALSNTKALSFHTRKDHWK
eukprot:TRINITY_DN2410_c0_g1_i1.p1 TRINITY_DN2410_c0_g1~~TRINITY_DN2410_c0_g1_i1.p1  ORF type:complete len:681 (+),score=285.23 TRINITY_DN2410_c0_g1_i1:29-2044(+)